MDITSQKTYILLFKQLNLIRIAIVAGMALFAAVTAFLVSNGALLPDRSLLPMFNAIVPALSVAMIVTSMMVYKIILQRLKYQPVLDEKMKMYRGVNIMRLAMLDGAALFAIVAALLTGQLLFLIVPAVMIIIMLLHKISPEAVAQELDLQYPEREQLVSDSRDW